MKYIQSSVVFLFATVTAACQAQAHSVRGGLLKPETESTDIIPPAQHVHWNKKRNLGSNDYKGAEIDYFVLVKNSDEDYIIKTLYDGDTISKSKYSWDVAVRAVMKSGSVSDVTFNMIGEETSTEDYIDHTEPFTTSTAILSFSGEVYVEATPDYDDYYGDMASIWLTLED